MDPSDMHATASMQHAPASLQEEFPQSLPTHPGWYNLQTLQQYIDQAVEARVQAAAPAKQLPQFRMPSVQPPKFDGMARNKQAHDTQRIIDEYLHRAEEMAKLHGFLADGQQASAANQPTYVQWVSTGLTDQALASWRQMDKRQRENLSWKAYCTWIHSTFSSSLTLQQAFLNITTLQQKGSALVYSQNFNNLVNAVQAHGCMIHPKLTCILYRNGLKSHLKENPSLFSLQSDLQELQKATEQLDEFHFRNNKAVSDKSRRSIADRIKSTTGNGGHHSFRANDPNAMDLSNVQTFAPLTPEERAIYQQNNWCTYCRAKSHAKADCYKLKRLREDRPTKKKVSLNNATVATSTAATATITEL